MTDYYRADETPYEKVDRLQDEVEKLRDYLRLIAVHLSHCNFGEHKGSCKYGYENCPALRNEWNWFGQNIQEAERLRVKNDVTVKAAWELLENLRYIKIQHPELGPSTVDLARYLAYDTSKKNLEDVLRNHRKLLEEGH